MIFDDLPPDSSGHPVAVKPPFSSLEASAEPGEILPRKIPPADLSARIRQCVRQPKNKDPAVRLAAQADLLDTMFTELILNGASGPGFDERFGLAFALRAQKQCRQTVEALETVVNRRQQNAKKDQNATTGLLSALLSPGPKGKPHA